MGNIFITPQWFFGYDIALEILFAVITLMVSYYAYKVYKLSGQKQSKLFSIAFLLIGISYIIQSILNFLILDNLDDSVRGIINIQSVYHLNLFGIYLHTIFFMIGLIILVSVASLKVEHTDVSFLLAAIIFAALYFTPYKVFMLYLFCTVLLAFIAAHYLINYAHNRKLTSLLVMVAMIALFLSSLQFIFAIDSSMFYVLGHLLELIAYILILTNMLIILRAGSQKLKNGKKT